MPDLIVIAGWFVLAIIAAVIVFLVWIARGLNREDDDASAARKGEQAVEFWGRK